MMTKRGRAIAIASLLLDEAEASEYKTQKTQKNPWAQDVNLTYIRRSEDALSVRSWGKDHVWFDYGFKGGRKKIVATVHLRNL